MQIGCGLAGYKRFAKYFGQLPLGIPNGMWGILMDK